MLVKIATRSANRILCYLLVMSFLTVAYSDTMHTASNGTEEMTSTTSGISSSSSKERDDIPSGRDILIETSKSCGGTTEFSSVETLRISGTITRLGKESNSSGSFLETFVLPGRSVLRTDSPIGRATMQIDGSSGWTLIQDQVDAMSQDEVLKFQVTRIGSLVWLLARCRESWSVPVLSSVREVFCGMATYRVGVKSRLGLPYFIYVDEASLVPLGISYVYDTAGREYQVVTRLGDHQRFGALLLPTKYVTEMSSGSKLSLIHI